jgi:hypothetical protein
MGRSGAWNAYFAVLEDLGNLSNRKELAFNFSVEENLIICYT